MLTFKNKIPKRTATKTSNAEITRFASLSQIGRSDIPQFGVGVVGCDIHMINRLSHIFLCNSRITVYITVKIAFRFASCKYLTA